ncbi:MAG: mucoidy inhibitor MuiA family protein [Nannocystis sp.]|uniref:mucoidy inhibitor MuiA family protein n=1 Tax=Nannocystis sp. TaxID=1962667 RepID=UPI002420D492|nr:mucoidy inhibitor MuiA family protein [Nannocystis sp.]MBK9756863.1 mucoidy inhibitor MuiA family protein [Nannocystis sp.]
MNIPVLTSRIDSVTVYRQGALVCRTAIVLAAQPVPPQIKLVNLPLSLDDGSVRVRVEGEGSDLPVASDVRVALDLAVTEQDLPPPDDEALKAARRAVAEIAERLAQLRGQRRRFERLQVFERPANKRGQPPLASPVRARLALLEFRAKAIAGLDERIHDALAQERRAVQVKEDLEHRQRAASKARQAKPHELRKAALIALRGHVTPTAPVRIVIEYMVPGARWAPSYAISLSKDMTQASVSVRAVVAQSTGEDWHAAKLTLSTADIQRWTELPELQVLRIGRRQPPVQRRGWRAPPAGAAELYADFDRFLAAGPSSTPPPAKPRPAVGHARAEPSPDLDALAMLSDDDEQPSFDGAAPMSTRSGGVERRKEAIVARPAPMPSAPPMPRSAAMAPSAPMPPQQAAPPSASYAPMRAQAASIAAPKGGAPMPLPGALGRGGGFGGLPEGGGGGGPAGFQALAPEPEHEAAPEQLAYGDLRMPDPKDSRRGSLIVSQRRERYLEMLWVREVTREIDVVALIDGAIHTAHRAGQGGPPPRHHLASSQGGFDYVYAADGTVDIPSDGVFHGIPLMSRSAPIELGYIVVPRESTDVFRHVKLKNPLDAPLLPGPADIYIGGDYLLSTDLRLAPPRGELKIGLGVEQAIKVSRNTSFAEESAGLMGGSLALRHEITIEVANRRERPVNVEVHERLPTLREREDEIQLDLAAVDPPWTAFEPEDYPLKGGHRWQIQVPAAQQKKLRVVYVIKISAKKELVGGNRREQ